MADPTITVATIDLIESSAPVAPAGISRFRRNGGVAERSADGSAYAPLAIGGWIDQRMNAIQKIAPTLTRATQFQCWNVTEEFLLATAAGTAVTAAAQDVPGGGIKFSTGTTNSSTQILSNRDSNLGATLRPTWITNLKTQPWAVVSRVFVNNALTGTETFTLAAIQDTAQTAADIWLALDGSTSTTALTIWVNGGGGTKLQTNLVPGTGVWRNVAMVFDGTTIWGMLDDVKSSAGLTDLTNVPSAAGGNFRMFVNNSTTGADRQMRLAKLAILSADV